MNTSQNTDTKPWYRQFWPWFIIALLGASIIMGTTFLYFAIHNADPVIDENYYQDGLDINKTLGQQDEKQHH